MYENNRDEINFHKFLKSVRNSQNVTQDQVGLGICSRSEMSRVEKGSRLPDKLVRDRMTARLGISGEDYEEYLLPREYVQWELRMEILHCINKKDIKGTEEKITEYETKYHDNSVDNQFVEAMRFMLYEMKGCSEDVLRKQIKRALDCTVKDMDAALDGLHLLSDQELNLIMEYVRLENEAPAGETLVEWKLREYTKVVTYIENSYMDRIVLTKVYSKIACFIAELVLTYCVEEEYLRYGLDLCSHAIEILRIPFRLYYFVELNEYRMSLIEKIQAYVAEGECEYIKEIYQTSKDWAILFHELCTENELPVYVENFTHLYTETECYNAVDVIRIRRKMMGLTQEKLGSMTCSAKTLSRIETGEVEPYMATVREIFDKLGLCAEYKRTRLITSDADVIRMSLDLIVQMNAGNYEKAELIHKELCSRIDMDVIFNEQEMRRAEAHILKGLGKLSQDEYRERLIDIMECTIAIDNIDVEGNNYLSREEISCVYNFALYTEGEIGDKFRKYCEYICTNLLEVEKIEATRLAIYEIIMYHTASRIGNNGEYMKSLQISRKLLKESLTNRRSLYIANCEYNELWNYQKLLELNQQPADNTYVYKSLTRGLILSELSRKEDWKLFFQQKLQKFSNNIMDERNPH